MEHGCALMREIWRKVWASSPNESQVYVSKWTRSMLQQMTFERSIISFTHFFTSAISIRKLHGPRTKKQHEHVWTFESSILKRFCPPLLNFIRKILTWFSSQILIFFLELLRLFFFSFTRLEANNLATPSLILSTTLVLNLTSYDLLKKKSMYAWFTFFVFPFQYFYYSVHTFS